METKANYALIGAFVLAAFIAVIGFIAWLSGSQFDQQFTRYEVVFSGPVRGLTTGGEVRFNGLRVGEVVRLSLDPEDSGSVLAAIEIDANTPVHTNSSAKLEPQGLTGLSYIQIFSGGDEFPLLKDLSRGPYQIPGEMSELDNLLEGGGDVLENAGIALARLNSLMNEESIANFQGILANTNRLSARLADADFDPETLNMLINDASQAARDLSATLETYELLASDVRTIVDTDVKATIAKIDATLGSIDRAVVSYEGVAGDGKDLITDARDAINRLSNSGLTDLEETTNSLRDLVGSLNRIAVQLEESPIQFIVGDERQQVEIPQ